MLLKLKSLFLKYGTTKMAQRELIVLEVDYGINHGH